MTNDFLSEDKVHGLLGAFWHSYYDSSEQVKSLVLSVVELQKQIAQESIELENALSRHTVDPFRKVLWYPVKVRKSQMEADSIRYAVYDADTVYGDGTLYGSEVGRVFTITVPSEIKTAEAAVNQILEPGFIIENPEIRSGKLILGVNPFDGSDFYVTEVYDIQGNVVDHEALIWLKNCEVDRDDIYNLFGYILGIKLPSSERYRDLVNAIMDSLVNGPSEGTLIKAVSAVTGIPVVRNDSETVISVSGNTITTDQQVYKFSDSDIITASPGDILFRNGVMSRGMNLVSGIDSPGNPDIPAMELTQRLVPIPGFNRAVILNSDQPVKAVSVDGYSRVDIPFASVTPDTKLFNDTMWVRGLDNISLIDDPCEISRIREILGIPNAVPESGDDPGTEYTVAGLNTWLRVHRFN